MTRRAWWFVAVGYALLAIGGLISIVVISRQADRIERQTNALEVQAHQIRASIGLFCEISRLDDIGERNLLTFIANGGQIGSLTPTCVKLVARVYREVD